MDYQAAFAISAAGMTAERVRVDVAAMNLAYANTALSSKGMGYVPLKVVATAPQAAASFDAMVGNGLSALLEVRTAPSRAPARQVYEPGHPQADRQGYVSYPGVDPIAEMATLMVSTRAYEADVAAFNAARLIATKALEIGSRT